MSSSRIFLYLCLSFLGGIALNSLIEVAQFCIFVIFIAGLIFISVFWKKNKKIVVAGFCLSVLAAGIYRHQMFERPADSLEFFRMAKKGAVGAEPPQLLGSLRLFRDKISESANNFLSPPQSSLLNAMMLGEEDGLSKEFKEKLNRSGTRHIVAISGMNIMILAHILIGIGLLFGMWRGQAFYFAIIAIVLFIIMIGAPPSAVRAGIMGGVVLLAEKMGRLSQATRLLIIAAAIMLAFNPLLLRFDVGFQLSFLATLGIIKLTPWFLERFSRVPNILQLRNIIAMTFPAVIFTAPILASNFNQISLISLLTNILIIPTLALVLGLGLFAALAGMFFEPIGSILFGPVWLLLTYVYKVIDISAALPFAVLKVESFPWYLAVLYFALLWWGIKRFKLKKN